MKHDPDHHDQMTTTDRLALTRAEAARSIGISERLLWSMTIAGKVPHVRVGRRVLYPKQELREWLSSQAKKLKT